MRAIEDKAAVARFVRRVRAGDACWEWAGAHTTAGYGETWANKRMVYAHRFAYELFMGPIPDNHSIDHLCRNPGCCRPDHLEPVTHSENLTRGREARRPNARTHCPKGHPYRPDRKKGYPCPDCMKEWEQSEEGRRYHREWARKRRAQWTSEEHERQLESKRAANARKRLDPEAAAKINAAQRRNYAKRQAAKKAQT